MPAYRSSAEAEVRDAVVARLRRFRPDARIMHEINVAGTGSNRVDVLAVCRAEIIAVEVKSARDKLDRLPDQIEAMRGAAHHVIAAIHEKHLVKKPDQYSSDTTIGIPRAFTRGADSWIFPELQRPGQWDHRWVDPIPALTRALPAAALSMLWQVELWELCGSLGMSMTRRATMAHMTNALRWSATGAQITKGICAALRARNATEADPPVRDAA